MILLLLTCVSVLERVCVCEQKRNSTGKPERRVSTVARTRLETGALRITLSLINISHLERYATNEREKEPGERENERREKMGRV